MIRNQANRHGLGFIAHLRKIASCPTSLRSLSRRKFRFSGPLIDTVGLKRADSNAAYQLSHKTIYRSLFIQARGALKKKLRNHLRRSRYWSNLARK